MTTSPINGPAPTSPINVLAQIQATSGQITSQLQLKLIGGRMTAQLNHKIAELKAQTNDPMLPILQHQAVTLNQRKTSYETAQGQLFTNGTAISDVNTQLATLAAAASAGDSAAFDQALTTANTDLSSLNVTPLLLGFQPDGAGSLKVNGLGIQSSAVYDLSTPAGQAQASADIAAAHNLVDPVSALTSQNELVATSVIQALDTQITSINRQVSAKQQAVTIDAAGQISQLQKTSQTQFHLLELAFGNISQTNTVLQSVAIAEANRSAPGSIFSIFA